MPDTENMKQFLCYTFHDDVLPKIFSLPLQRTTICEIEIHSRREQGKKERGKQKTKMFKIELNERYKIRVGQECQKCACIMCEF